MKIVDEKPTVTSATCETHGEYEIKFQPYLIDGKFMVFDECPVCTKLENQKREQEQAETRKIREAEETINFKKRAGLRKRHLDCTLENYQVTTESQQRALGKVRSYVSDILNNQYSNLVMAGRVGTGKTHLAAAIISKLAEKRISCSIIKLPEMIREIKNSWNKGGETESQIIERLSRLKLLIIDEVGVQYGSDTEKLLLSEIIDNRYQEMLPTVLISNLDVDGIKQCIGERCYDRLRQDGGIVAAFDWDSHRGVKA